uniref:ADAM metallopeptidase with thrombospondin type 1 motif, 15a n=1 Tax=Eptatretus burgeri TaxID=7764 RepID=A0A8C4N9N0_EPTBU
HPALPLPLPISTNIPSLLHSPLPPGREARPVSVSIGAFEQRFLLTLQPDDEFLAPGYSESRLGVPPDIRGYGLEPLRTCFYSGSVDGDRESTAALSICGGLMGSFWVNGQEYFISPRVQPKVKIPVVHDPRWVSEGRVVLEQHLLETRERRDSGIDPQPIEASRCGVNTSMDENIHRWTRPLRRVKRFASKARFVEILVVADESMVRHHGNDLEHYLLTLMGIAARLYRHPSLQNAVRLVVVRLLILGVKDKGPKVSSNAALTLRTFCSWQKRLNRAADKHVEHFDTAVLFTKKDLCGTHTCDTLGMADVGTMCDPRRSCSVIEDDGLPAAYTTAHELGHVFNMPHDNAGACRQAVGMVAETHMMSPTITRVDHDKPWSICSDCLLDPPAHLLALPTELPGTAYSATQQCELAFGRGSRPCPFTIPCARLWCTGHARGHLVCQTRHFPWADGTHCGRNRSCRAGQCVDKSLDGVWGKWGSYEQCSLSCGGGVQLARRLCDSPAPANGGSYCVGTRLKYRSCNLQACPSSNVGFREEQCAKFDGKHVHTNAIMPSAHWLPKYSGVAVTDQCKLICRANGTGYYFVLAPKVADGTRCSLDSSDVCVQGRCIPAGCDGRLRSRVRVDQCGVCGGEGATCRKVSRTFTKSQYGYNYVVTIPAGATKVDIRQRGYKGLNSDDNYLALRGSEGKYLLNGNYIVTTAARDVVLQGGGGGDRGGVLYYTGTATKKERLHGPGPLPGSVVVEVLSVGRMTPPRVRYSYYVSQSVDTSPKHKHREKKRKQENESTLRRLRRCWHGHQSGTSVVLGRWAGRSFH